MPRPATLSAARLPARPRRRRPIMTRPIYRSGPGTAARDVEPIAGARAARDLELAARGIARDTSATPAKPDTNGTRSARPSASSPAANPTPGRDACRGRIRLRGRTGPTPRRRGSRSFAWTCPTCQQPISDRGLIKGPADDEHGHAEHCARLAVAIAWQAEWEAGR